MTALLLWSGCQDAPVRPVWVASVSPSTIVPACAHITLLGSGLAPTPPEPSSADALSAAPTPAPATPDAECPTPPGKPGADEALDAVLVRGVAAYVTLRTDGRIDLIVPDLTPGPAFLVVWSAGTASNAVPLTIVTSVEIDDGDASGTD